MGRRPGAAAPGARAATPWWRATAWRIALREAHRGSHASLRRQRSPSAASPPVQRIRRPRLPHRHRFDRNVMALGPDGLRLARPARSARREAAGRAALRRARRARRTHPDAPPLEGRRRGAAPGRPRRQPDLRRPVGALACGLRTWLATSRSTWRTHHSRTRRDRGRRRALAGIARRRQRRPGRAVRGRRRAGVRRLLLAGRGRPARPWSGLVALLRTARLVSR